MEQFEKTERYFVMNDEYDFVEVSLKIYDNPDEFGYIGNRVCFRKLSDGAAFLDTDLHNCDAGSFGDLYRKLFP